jgi:hypothetical protein
MADKLTVVEALSAAMAEVQAVGKGDRNNEQGYNFRGIDAVVNAVGPVFRKHGIVPVPVKTTASYRDVLTSREKRSRECTVTVTYRFYGPAGDFIDAEVPGESMDFGDKGAPKAMSVAYRILLLQTLCIPTHEPEPDSQSYERVAETDGPSEAQEITASDFAEEIQAAAMQPTINDIAGRVKRALDAGRITGPQYQRLGRMAVARVQAIGGVRDSTGDGDGGSAEADPAGQGPVSGGVGAGGGGAGRGGEEGGVRSGVQSGVHRGNRSDRPSQASGDDRNAPAAVGQ